MSSTNLIVAALFVTLLLGGPLLSGSIPVGATPAAQSTPGQEFFQQSFEADTVLIEVSLDSTGDADWTVRYRVDIGSQNESAAFDDLQEDIRRNTSTYLDPFRQRMRATASAAENATGRSMTVANFSVRTRTEALSESGFVTYEFDWQNFAVRTDQDLTAGDAIAGLFLDAGTTLTLRWPAELSLQSVKPSPTRRDDNSVTWTGQQRFSADEPRLVTEPPGSGQPGWTILVLGVIVVGLLIIGAGLMWAHRTGESVDGAEVTDAGDTEVKSVPPERDESSSEKPDGPPSDLLKNEEQVLELLENSGGRIKQQDVVSALDWTEAKTSQVITDMREAGDVEVFRIGRENVITLPETDLTENAESSDDGSDEDNSEEEPSGSG